MNQLTVENVVKSYKGRVVVNGVSFKIATGEVIGLLGPNGAGKTTTFYTVVGLVTPDSGVIAVNGKDITKLPMFQRAYLGLGYLPQEPSIFRKLTVAENIMAILETMSFNSKQEREDRLTELLAELSITKIANSLGSSLSGGERRRVEISRALARDPMFILLDEPFAGIDPIVVNEIQEIIINLKNRGIGILITDHNVRETLGICDRAYIMVDGNVMVEGTPEDIANDDDARRFYLGNDFKLR